jgi:hypothetical protein
MAKFQKGQSGNPAGKPKGSKDRRREFYNVIELLQQNNHNPFQAMIDLAKDPNADADLRLKANKELGLRAAPPIKAIEHIDDTSLQADLESLRNQLEQLTLKYVREY